MPNRKKDLETVLSGDLSRLSHEYTSTFDAKWHRVRDELIVVGGLSSKISPQLIRLVTSTRNKLTPNWLEFQPEQADLEDLSFFKFIEATSSKLLNQVEHSAAQLGAIAHAFRVVEPMFEGTADFGTLSLADRAATEMYAAANEEYSSVVVGFNQIIAEIYLLTRREYKNMRRKYLGGSAQPEQKDDLEDRMMMQLFGMKQQPPEVVMGPAKSLIGGNCVLTQFIDDVSRGLPRHYERIVPIMKKGKVTTETQTIRDLDEGEIEDCAELLISISNPQTWEFVNDPNKLLATFLDTLISFHSVYAPMAKALEDLAKTSAAVIHKQKNSMMSPKLIERRYKAINFLAIQPRQEDVAPKTRVERDYEQTRQELFLQLRETLEILSKMDRNDPKIQEYAIMRVKESIDLREKMDDITRSEKDKRISRNIQGDNEFYVGKTGQIGALEIEREAAPTITYSDVIGATFIKAKQHVEEVVKIASHPHIMRVSSPRGDVRSNLLFIGPLGCGKTELAKAICGDPRIIGVNLSVGDMLTAYMHESVKNVKRAYDHASELRRGSRYTKPVGIVLDEFDRLFSYGEGVHAAYDGDRMTGALQEQMDGVVGREGIFLVAMTNFPKAIPEAVLRRFKFVDVVGQLTLEEITTLLKKFLNRGLPIDPSVTEEHYMAWAKQLEDAPGDVIGKVADEVHFKFMHEFVFKSEKIVARIERSLTSRLKNKEISEFDRIYLRRALAKHRTISANEISASLEEVLKQPQVKMQIRKAREVYRDAAELLKSIEKGIGFGAQVRSSSSTWDKSS